MTEMTNTVTVTLATFRSRTRPDVTHRVTGDGGSGAMTCTCEAFRFTGRCRHVRAAEMVFDDRGRPAICSRCGGGMQLGVCATCRSIDAK